MDLSDFFAINPQSYSLAIELFLRLLGAIYVIAYVPFLFQIRGLIGEDGILPVSRYLSFFKPRLGKKGYFYIPTLWWINSSDKALIALISIGIFLGVLLMLGFNPAILLPCLYIIHLSLTTAGQDFLSFGWETFLMEITVSTFLLVATTPYNILGWINLNFLLFRFFFAAGLSKIFSHDRNWRNLTAIAYHYLTQPLPNTIAYFFHKLPLKFHKISTFFMFFIELVTPFTIFAPPVLRLLAFVQFFGLQFFIWLTGNLSFLNHMTAIFCLILIHNQYLEPFLGAPTIPETASPLWWQAFIYLLALGQLFLQIVAQIHLFTRSHKTGRILSWVQIYHLAYPHGIFAIMTTKRYEIIVEGSNDGKDWQEYHFYYKPGDLKWRPRRISPYQPRIDWQAWFLPFETFDPRGWFQAFLFKLLQGAPHVLKLIKHNPFPDKPPKYIRALMYDYEYTTLDEKKATGNWWKRRLMGEYSPTYSLRR